MTNVVHMARCTVWKVKDHNNTLTSLAQRQLRKIHLNKRKYGGLQYNVMLKNSYNRQINNTTSYIPYTTSVNKKEGGLTGAMK